MNIVVQNCMGLYAFLLDDKRNIIASEPGDNDLEAIGRLVARNPKKFNLSKVTRKFGKINFKGR
jgi:hypothetical protein